MSQHAVETCGENNGLWLPLTEYAVKSGLSTSTLRRKIKTNSIPFKVEKGRYLILFGNESMSSEIESKAVLEKPLSLNTSVRPSVKLNTSPALKTEEWKEEKWMFPIVDKTFQTVSAAFERTLREKDERIKLLEKRNLELSEMLTELRLLVRVLEEKYEVRY